MTVSALHSNQNYLPPKNDLSDLREKVKILVALKELQAGELFDFFQKCNKENTKGRNYVCPSFSKSEDRFKKLGFLDDNGKIKQSVKKIFRLLMGEQNKGIPVVRLLTFKELIDGNPVSYQDSETLKILKILENLKELKTGQYFELFQKCKGEHLGVKNLGYPSFSESEHCFEKLDFLKENGRVQETVRKVVLLTSVRRRNMLAIRSLKAEEL